MRRVALLVLSAILVSSCGSAGEGKAGQVGAARARARPVFGVLTALPLFWGEGRFGDALRGDQDARTPFIQALAKQGEVRALDALDGGGAGAIPASITVLILAQPRRLAPQELVAIDNWVQGGGQVIAFADPLLDWPSRYPLGDARRAPPVTLLDPLFSHWGLTLEGGSDGAKETRTLGEATVATKGAGHWATAQGSGCTIDAPDGLVARCAVGRGRAVWVADADLLMGENGAASAGFVAGSLVDN